MSAPPGPPAAPARWSNADHLRLSCYWLAYNLQWVALLAIVLPSQVALIAGAERKEAATGLVIAAGALVSLVWTPLAGAWSDRSGSRFGRRRPFIVIGTLVNVVFLALLAGMGPGTALAAYLVAYLGVQLGSNWAGGPYAALIPDVVPAERRGVASGWMALMTTLGTLAGALLAGALARPGRYLAIYAAIAVALLAATLVTLGVREPRARRAEPAAGWREAFPDLATHRDFYWVLATRCLVGMGIYSVFSFFQFFLADVQRVPDPEAQASYLIGVIIAAGLPTGLLAGALSDRTGRKPLVYLSGGVMAVAATAFIAAGAAASPAAIFLAGALFGIGYGAYQAADWALAVDVLPPGENAGKDMGIWHVALVLPQVAAPALSGVLLSALKPWSIPGAYAVVFVAAALWFTLGTVLVRRVRGAR